MSLIPVLLAGTVGSGTQNHQASQWGPNLAAAGFVVEAVWTPPTVGDPAIERARALAASFGMQAQVADQPDTRAAGAIACLRGTERADFMTFAAQRSLAVLLDKPTLDSTSELEKFAAAADGATVLAGHHFLSHPGFTRALAAVRNAEIGLLRAVSADLVSGGGEPAAMGELRNLGVYLVEMIRQATGPAAVTLQAHASPAADAWSFLGKTDRGVVVSAHVSRASAGADVPVRTLRAKLRLVGTHGSMLIDLTRPVIGLSTVTGAGTLPFAGENSVVAHLKRFAAVIAGAARPAPASDLIVLSSALDAITESASSGDTASLSW
jgi:predicted dehydrogenase